MLRFPAFAATLLIGLPACFQAQSDAPVPSDSAGNHGVTGGTRGRGAGAGGAASGGGTSGGGSSGGGSSAGVSGGAAGTGASGGAAGGGSTGGSACAANGDLEFSSQLVDVGSNSPIPGLTVTTFDINGLAVPGAEGISDDGGYVNVCTPANEEIHLGIEGQNYPPTVTEDFIQTQDISKTSQPVLLISSAELSILGTVLSSSVPLQAGKVVIAAAVSSEHESSPCSPQVAGWKLSLSLLDGGSLPSAADGGLPYTTVYL
ncbi:MAG TPA: hypothetical protein VMB50_22800, partial [Myxococcales bacterium]|nr:hypothetical protein [Myxococcales bacterium]